MAQLVLPGRGRLFYEGLLGYHARRIFAANFLCGKQNLLKSSPDG